METPKTLPAWVPPVAAGVALVLVVLAGFAVWRNLPGRTVPVGQDIKVRPGMYDMRSELQKPHGKAPQ